MAPATAVVMSQHRSAVAMARPPATGGITLGEERAVRITAGEDVMPGRRHLRACLGERGIPSEIDTLAVEFLDAGSNLSRGNLRRVTGAICAVPKGRAGAIA